MNKVLYDHSLTVRKIGEGNLDMDVFDQYVSTSLLHSIQNVVIALIVLLVGWLIAKLIGNGVEKALNKTALDEKLFNKFSTSKTKPDVDTNKIIAKTIYYILLVIVFIVFFNILNLQVIASPLADLISSFFGFIPAVLKAALILALAFVLALVIQWGIVKGGKKSGLGKLFVKLRVAETIEKAEEYIVIVGRVAFYLILLLFIPGVLDALSIQGVAEPFSGLLNTILSFIPKLISAVIIFAIGWLIASIIKTIVTNLLTTLGSEKLVTKLRLQNIFEGTSLAIVVGNIVFILIMIPITITSLEQLELTGITDPAISMLNQVMNMIPNLIIAAALILVGIWLGKLIGNFVESFLTRVGFNKVSANMKLGNKTVSNNKMTPSRLVGYVVQVLIVFFLTVQALYLIKLDFLVAIASAITAYLPHVLAAVLIIGIALIVGNIVEKVVKNMLNGPAVQLLAVFAKYAILVLAGFMALAQLGIATSIVASAFTIILGGLALAFGLAFGLGGKEFAQKYLKKADENIEQMKTKKTE